MSALNSLKKYLKGKGQEINDEWYVKIETRKSGKSMGMTDNYYFSPEGKRFRSMIEVYRFLTTGDKFERDEKTKCLKINKENNDEIMDDLCELVSDMYINDNIKNLHDTNSGMFRKLKKDSINFIDCKLQKTKIQNMSEKYSITIPKDTPEENIIHYSKANAANLVKNFFRSAPSCLGCGAKKNELQSGGKKCILTHAHTIKSRPEILKMAVSESRTEEGYQTHVILRKFIELHKQYPVATLCWECHHILG